jgi:hypothetical protein
VNLYNMGEEEDYEYAENGGNGNHRPSILQHIRSPNPIVFTDNMQRAWEEWIMQFDFWASTQWIDSLPPKIQADWSNGHSCLLQSVYLNEKITQDSCEQIFK